MLRYPLRCDIAPLSFKSFSHGRPRVPKSPPVLKRLLLVHMGSMLSNWANALDRSLVILRVQFSQVRKIAEVPSLRTLNDFLTDQLRDNHITVFFAMWVSNGRPKSSRKFYIEQKNSQR